MSEQNQLPFSPAGWEWTTLGEISFVNPRWWDFELNDDDLISFVPMAAVEEETGRLDASIIKRWEEVKQGYTRFQENDVLFAKITPSMENGKAAVALNLWEGRGVGSTEFHVLRPTSGVLPKQILYFLLQKSFRDSARRAMKGVAGQLRVPPEFVAQATFPLPPLPEQQRIVDEIEKQFSRVDAAAGILQRVGRNLERLRTATLKAAVEGQLVTTEAELARADTRDYEPANILLQRILREHRAKWEADQLARMKERGRTPNDDKWKEKYPVPAKPDTNNLPELPEGWAWATVEQLNPADRPCAYGVLIPGKDISNGIPLIRVGDIDNGRIQTERLKRIEPKIAQGYERTKLQGGEVLITLVGTIGRTAVVPPNLAGANTARAVGVIPVINAIPSTWVELYFRNPDKVWEMDSKAHEVARKTLNLEDVRTASVAIPPVAEQHRIISEVERRLSVIEELKTLVTNALQRAVILRQKILRDAFAGKLVPQDPGDEPASVLLERIHAEKVEREAGARQARKERGKMKGRKANTAGRKSRRPLREVVAESKRRLAPEQLFADAGFASELIEDFYEELRREIKAGHIEQVRPDNTKVYLIAASNA